MAQIKWTKTSVTGTSQTSDFCSCF